MGVYFGRRDGVIKIGCSKDVYTRAARLGLTLIGFIPCDRQFVYQFEWAAILRNYDYLACGPDACKVRGEWYQDRPEVVQTLHEGLEGLLSHLGSSVAEYKKEQIAAYAKAEQRKPVIL